MVLSGCSAAHHRRAADKEVYGILQTVEATIFGTTNQFTVDTPYSTRDPKSITPAELIDERSATNRRLLNLEESIDLAVRHSREYQTEKENLYLSALSLTGSRYEFTPQFFAGSTAKITEDPISVENTPGATDRQLVGSVNNRVGVSQLLKTGGRLSLSLGNDLVRYFTRMPANETRNSAVNLLSVELAQPLLRGFGINDPAVENLTQAEREVVYDVRTFSRFQQSFAAETVNAYFRLLTQKDEVRNFYRNFTNRVETTRYLEARAVDRERKANADDARTAELSARNSYINSIASYLDTLDAFKIRLGLPPTESIYLDDRDLQDLIASGVDPVDLDAEAAFRISLEKQTEILSAIDRFEDSKRRVRLAADQLRAGLNFDGGASLASEGPDDYLHFDPEKVRYSASLTLNLPIDRLLERNSYRRALITFESQLRSLTLTLDNYRNRIDEGLRTIEKARLTHLNSVESLKVAERRVDNNAMLLEFGRATIRDLREAQDSLIEAQNNLANTYTSYLTARLALLVDLGVLDISPEKFWLNSPFNQLVPPEQRKAPPLRMPEDRVLPPELFLEPSL